MDKKISVKKDEYQIIDGRERENLNDDKGFEITSHEVELDQNEEDNAISYEIKIGGGD